MITVELFDRHYWKAIERVDSPLLFPESRQALQQAAGLMDGTHWVDCSSERILANLEAWAIIEGELAAAKSDAEALATWKEVLWKLREGRRLSEPPRGGHFF